MPTAPSQAFTKPCDTVQTQAAVVLEASNSTGAAFAAAACAAWLARCRRVQAGALHHALPAALADPLRLLSRCRV